MTRKISLKIAERSEAKKVAARRNSFFDAKLHFALLASLRSAIFSEILLNNKMVILRKG